MLAIDTNVVVRVLAQDDPVQIDVALDLMRNNDVWVSLTVVLEVNWVLRSSYGCSRTEALSLIRSFVGIPRVYLEEPERVRRAIQLAEAGMEFADALHFASASGQDGFATFNQAFAKVGNRLGLGGIRAL